MRRAAGTDRSAVAGSTVSGGLAADERVGPATGPSRREVGLVAAALLVLAAAVFGRHIATGQLSSDDWSSLDAYRHLPDPGYLGLVGAYQDAFGGKPLLTVLLALPPALFGDVVPAWLSMAVALGAATSVCWFVVLRTLGLHRLAAAGVAGLTLLAPWSSSARLWATAGVNNVAVCCFLVGLVVALRALRRPGPSGHLRHGGAVVLYVASVLTYEIAGTAALAAGALYLGRAPRRTAVLRWAVDVLAVGAALLWSAGVTNKPIPSPAEQLAGLRSFVRDSVVLTGEVVLPLGTPWPVGVLLLAVLAVGTVSCLRRTGDPELRRRLSGWLGWAALGLGGTVASYVVLLPSAYYTPLSAGLENRVNIMAALPMTLFVVAAWMVGLTLVLRGERRLVWAAAVLLLLPLGYGARLLEQQHDWREAARLQGDVLSALTQMPAPAPGSTVYVYGVPATVAPRLPVFADTWDLNSAVRLTRGDPSLRGYPVVDGARLECGPEGIRPQRLPGLHGDLAPGPGQPPEEYVTPWWGVDQGAPYGSVVLLDVPSGQSRVLTSQEDCSTAVATSVPGRLDPAHR